MDLIGMKAFTKIAFEDIYLGVSLDERQEEEQDIFDLLSEGQFGEIPSMETAYHMRRVAEYSYLLATEYGIDHNLALMFKMASPLHDIGKVGIDDSILNKKGIYTRVERGMMEHHCYIGHKLLSRANGQVFKLASIIAYEHHERWDGMGYPEGKIEDEINIFSRITTLADVFDALSQKRLYKESWEIAKVRQYILNESGKIFDPHLVQIFFKNFHKIVGIMNQYKD